jgi:hypothetical protein
LQNETLHGIRSLSFPVAGWEGFPRAAAALRADILGRKPLIRNTLVVGDQRHSQPPVARIE